MNQPNPYNITQHALAILRICLWFIPGVMLASAIFLLPYIGLRRSWSLPILWIVFFFIGYFDMLLKFHIEKTDPKPIKCSLFTWALAFASIQIIIAPAVVVLMICCYKILGKIIGIP